ncbi:MAG: universal stress protein [Euryarchaeota archaeon]|nr:universal stress protein [Euryarchaeota archaeon]
MYNKILVATDGSTGAKKAEEQAIEIAKKFGAQLTALYVVDQQLIRTYEATITIPLGAVYALERELTQKSKEILEDIKSKAEKESIQIETKVRKGNPWEEIVKETKVNKYSLLVIGSASRKGMLSFLGSVAERVLANARCPVLIARSLPEIAERPRVIPSAIVSPVKSG